MRTRSTHHARHGFRKICSTKAQDQFFITSIEISFKELLSKLAVSNFVSMKHVSNFGAGEMRMISDVGCQIEMKMFVLNY